MEKAIWRVSRAVIHRRLIRLHQCLFPPCGAAHRKASLLASPRDSFTLESRARAEDGSSPSLDLGDHAIEGSPPKTPSGTIISYRRDQISTPITFDALFLRDACTCSQCVDPSTGQKRFETAQLPLNPGIRKQETLKDGTLEITWKEGPGNDLEGVTNHKSTYSTDFLNRFPRKKLHLSMRNTWPYVPWNRMHMEAKREALTFDFANYMRGDGWRPVVYNLLCYGLVFLRDVPASLESVTRIAERIGPVRDTFYGRAWDVKSVARPANVAYTSGALDFHQDLLYMTDPPAVQFLHCLRQSAEGGESQFSDAARAFSELYCASQDLALAFARHPVTYEYKNRGHWYRRTRPHLEGGVLPLKALDRLDYPWAYQAVNWSPPFQGAFEIAAGAATPYDGATRAAGDWLRQYVTAARAFKEKLARPDAVYETKLKEGECVIFHNRRIVHARSAFTVEAEGDRWLRGCYMDEDPLRSRWRMMKYQEKANKPEMPTVPYKTRSLRMYKSPKGLQQLLEQQGVRKVTSSDS